MFNVRSKALVLMCIIYLPSAGANPHQGSYYFSSIYQKMGNDISAWQSLRKALWGLLGWTPRASQSFDQTFKPGLSEEEKKVIKAQKIEGGGLLAFLEEYGLTPQWTEESLRSFNCRLIKRIGAEKAEKYLLSFEGSSGQSKAASISGWHTQRIKEGLIESFKKAFQQEPFLMALIAEGLEGIKMPEKGSFSVSNGLDQLIEKCRELMTEWLPSNQKGEEASLIAPLMNFLLWKLYPGGLALPGQETGQFFEFRNLARGVVARCLVKWPFNQRINFFVAGVPQDFARPSEDRHLWSEQLSAPLKMFDQTRVVRASNIDNWRKSTLNYHAKMFASQSLGALDRLLSCFEDMGWARKKGEDGAANKERALAWKVGKENNPTFWSEFNALCQKLETMKDPDGSKKDLADRYRRLGEGLLGLTGPDNALFQALYKGSFEKEKEGVPLESKIEEALKYLPEGSNEQALPGLWIIAALREESIRDLCLYRFDEVIRKEIHEIQDILQGQGNQKSQEFGTLKEFKDTLEYHLEDVFVETYKEAYREGRAPKLCVIPPEIPSNASVSTNDSEGDPSPKTSLGALSPENFAAAFRSEALYEGVGEDAEKTLDLGQSLSKVAGVSRFGGEESRHLIDALIRKEEEGGLDLNSSMQRASRIGCTAEPDEEDSDQRAIDISLSHEQKNGISMRVIFDPSYLRSGLCIYVGQSGKGKNLELNVSQKLGKGRLQEAIE